MSHRHTSRQQGFTLIEAAVAIAVVAILSGIIVPLVVKNLQDSQNARAKNDIQVIAAAIASQIKDTGSRPTAAGAAATGAGEALWNSGGTMPTNVTQATAANTFANLFSVAKTVATQQQMFYGATTTVTSASEFAYKGPYLADDVAAKSDPWGHAYVIAGYGAAGQTASSPIWVICAGPDGAVNTTANPVATAASLPTVWTPTTTSADDIVVRVN